MKRISLALLLVLSLPAGASDKSDSDESVSAMVECSAVWEWSSEAMAAAGKPAAAEYLRNMARGAKTSAAWLLAQQHLEDSPDEAPRTYGSWFPYLEPRIDGELSRIRALAEADDNEFLGTQMELCTEISKVQADIIDGIRQQYKDG